MDSRGSAKNKSDLVAAFNRVFLWTDHGDVKLRLELDDSARGGLKSEGQDALDILKRNMMPGVYRPELLKLCRYEEDSDGSAALVSPPAASDARRPWVGENAHALFGQVLQPQKGLNHGLTNG